MLISEQIICLLSARKAIRQTFSYLLGFYIMKHYKQHKIKFESEEKCKSRHIFITTLTEDSLMNATYREIFAVIVWQKIQLVFSAFCWDIRNKYSAHPEM